MFKVPVAYLVRCRDLGYLGQKGSYWTGIQECETFESFTDAESAAFMATCREPHLLGDVEPVACYVDHWGEKCQPSSP